MEDLLDLDFGSSSTTAAAAPRSTFDYLAQARIQPTFNIAHTTAQRATSSGALSPLPGVQLRGAARGNDTRTSSLHSASTGTSRTSYVLR